MRKSMSLLLVVALVGFFSLPAFATPITNTLETRTFGTQNNLGIPLNPDMSFDRTLLADFDPMSPQYMISGDFTDSWIDTDLVGHSSHGKFTFDLTGFTHQNLSSAFLEIGYAGFETADMFPRIGIHQEDGHGGYINRYMFALNPDQDGDYLSEMFWFDLDLFGDLLTDDTVTLTLNFLKHYGDTGEGAVDYIRMGAWGNAGGPSNPVPEPSTILLFGAGLLGVAGVGRRRKKNVA